MATNKSPPKVALAMEERKWRPGFQGVHLYGRWPEPKVVGFPRS